VFETVPSAGITCNSVHYLVEEGGKGVGGVKESNKRAGERMKRDFPLFSSIIT
jgi:hypothetical protein